MKNLNDKIKDHASVIKKHKLAFLISLILLIGVIGWLKSPGKKAHAPQLENVIVDKAKSADVPVYLNALGGVTPLDSVTVKTQINGQMQAVFFKEGQMVKKNTLLAQIDERPLLAQLMQYEGQLAHDMAALENARLDLHRYETLWAEDSISKQTLDTQASLVKQLEGTVKSDHGLINSTRVNLMYCRIVSPINGRIGLRLIDPGNFVQTSDQNGLFVINTLNPITVVFSLPEDNIPAVMKKIKEGGDFIVEAYDRAQNALLATGSLLTIDNQIDSSTGTVKLKALFKNDDNILFPNQFVNIKLLVNTIKKATIIPTTAIQYGNKKFVYLYNAETHRVHIQPIEVGTTYGDYTVVSSGIKPGESLVIEGTDKLVEGLKVNIDTRLSFKQ